MFGCSVQITQILVSQGQIKFGLSQGGIATDRELVFSSGLFYASPRVESFSKVQLGLRILRQNFRNFLSPLKKRHDAADELCGAKRSKGNYQCRPSQAVPNPRRPKPRRCQGSRPSSFDAKNGARLRL